MADATFQGTYSDIKLVRGRKVAQVVVEIPIEAATAFVAAFGMPDPAEETWVALARLGTHVMPPKEKRDFRELPRSQQAALACKREDFQRFVCNDSEASELAAADYVRGFCGVESRSELATNDEAAAEWDDLYQQFEYRMMDMEQANGENPDST
jgi:hypothetical protein